MPTNNALDRQSDSLVSLFGRLTDELAQLFDAKLELLKAELRREGSAYALGVVLVLIGVVIAIVGFALSELVMFVGMIAVMPRGVLRLDSLVEAAKTITAAGVTILLLRSIPGLPPAEGMVFLTGLDAERRCQYDDVPLDVVHRVLRFAPQFLTRSVPAELSLHG